MGLFGSGPISELAILTEYALLKKTKLFIWTNDCALDFSQFKSRLTAHNDLKLEPEIRDNDKKILFQQGTLNYPTTDLKTGKEIIEKVHVEFQGGGCEHLVFSLTASDFSTPRLMHRYTKKYIVLALNIVQKTFNEIDATIFSEALKKTKQQVSPKEKIPKNKSKVIPLDCGSDAQCSLEVINTTKIKLTYDFML